MQKLTSVNKIRVLLVDDHMAIRMGLMTAIGDALDMEVVADVEDGEEGLVAYRKHRPDVVIVDLRMQGMSGVELIRALRQEFGSVRILIYSNYARGEEVYQAINAGASGVVVKEMPLDELLSAIRAVYSGEKYIPTQVAAKIGERMLSKLSQREMEVLQLLAKGLSNKEIASRLGLVVGTVKIYVANIFSKLGVSDRTQALVTAVKRGIIDIE
jgi:DNA-binding NarL/FixJ family response regulator